MAAFSVWSSCPCVCRSLNNHRSIDMSDAEPRLPLRPQVSTRSVALPRKRGRTIMPSLACPRCKTVGSIYRIPEKLEIGSIKLDLPYFSCAQCGTRWYDYTEMLAYIMARNEMDRLKETPDAPKALSTINVSNK